LSNLNRQFLRYFQFFAKLASCLILRYYSCFLYTTLVSISSWYAEVYISICRQLSISNWYVAVYTRILMFHTMLNIIILGVLRLGFSSSEWKNVVEIVAWYGSTHENASFFPFSRTFSIPMMKCRYGVPLVWRIWHEHFKKSKN